MRRAVPLSLLLAAALAGCGADDERPATPAAPPDSTRLTVEVTEAAPEPIRITLRCGGAEPCREDQLRRLDAALADAADRSRACTAQYGGPEQARVSGTLGGRRVDVTIARSDGCGIGDYKALFEALGRKPPLAG